jgi:protein TonB
MKHYLAFFILFYTSTVCAQQDREVRTNREPSYVKGDPALYAEVSANLKYPEAAIKKYVEGEVTLSFDVKPDSTVTNVMIINGVGSGVDEEVKKYIQSLKFLPGLQNGRPVRMSTMYTFPVKAH